MPRFGSRLFEAFRRRTSHVAPAPHASPAAGPGGRSDDGPASSAASLPDDPRALAARLGVDYLPELTEQPVDSAFLAAAPIAFAREHLILGLASDEQAMPVAISSAANLAQLDALGRLLARPVRPVLAEREQIAAAVDRAYQQQSVEVDHLLGAVNGEKTLDQAEGLTDKEDLLDFAARAPVIQLVNLTLFEAVKQQASDVHIQPYEDRLIVRLRIDGVLGHAFDLPRSVHEEMVSRVKVMGRMDIAEKRLPQDGRATVQLGDRLIDLRIASLPTRFGERLVIRLLDKSARLYRLDDLGMGAGQLDQCRDLIGCDHGLILVTGPTGSGKTTTLYAALLEMDNQTHNTLTLEDPIEYQLPDVSQTQVSTKKGMTFAGGLRSVLRQDPDIIMVGEVRDHETATMTIQAALTGHLVFSTLHTNDAAGAITRLLDLGIEPYLVASSVIGILAQRLVRRVCPDCAEPYQITADELARLGAGPDALSGRRVLRAVGCEQCRGTGFRGRIGLFELLPVNEAVRGLIAEPATASRIKAAAVDAGLRTLRDEGLDKVLGGQTTVGEVVRVTARATE